MMTRSVPGRSASGRWAGIAARLATTSWLAFAVSLAAHAQPAYKVSVVPIYGDLHNYTVHTSSSAINRHGMMASGLYQELGGGYSLRCDKTACVRIPPLGGCHHCSTTAVDINDAGQVVGSSPYQWFERAFLFDDAGILNLGAFREGSCDGCDLGSYAMGINNLGQVVGAGETEAGPWRAFVWHGGTMQKLGTLGGDSSVGVDINDDGDVAGNSVRLDGQSHAFLYRKGRMRDLGTLGGTWSSANGINEARQVVGCSALPGNAQTAAFIQQDGLMTALPTLGGSYACATGINSRGWVVGSARTAGDAEWRGFLYDGVSVIDLNELLSAADRALWVVTYATGINKSGQIVAVGTHRQFDSERALLLTPRRH